MPDRHILTLHCFFLVSAAGQRGRQALRGSQKPHFARASPAQDAVDAVGGEQSWRFTLALGPLRAALFLVLIAHGWSFFLGLRERTSGWLPLLAGGMNECVMGVVWKADYNKYYWDLCSSLSPSVAGCGLSPWPQPELVLSSLRTSGYKCSELRARSSGVSRLHVLRAALWLALDRGRAASVCRHSAKRELDYGGASEGGGRGLAAGTHQSQFLFLSFFLFLCL